jgi:colicin import membrane protein
MKIYILLLFILVAPFTSFSQSKKDLKEEIKTLQEQVQKLQTDLEVLKARMDDKISALQNEVAYIRSQSSTTSTTQTSNPQPLYTDNSYNKTDTVSKTGLTPRTGAIIYTGPRGGKYYINKNGNKTYIKH